MKTRALIPISASSQELCSADISTCFLAWFWAFPKSLIGSLMPNSSVESVLRYSSRVASLSGLDRQSRININILLKAILDEELVPELKEDLQELIVFEIGNQKFFLFFEKTEVSGSYLISDFFKAPLMLAIDLNGEKFPVPQYSILTKENYLELANLDFNAMLRSYKEMAGNPVYTCVQLIPC